MVLNLLIHIYVSLAVYTNQKRFHLKRLGGEDTVILQSNCAWRTWSRSLHSNCPGRGSNSYPPHYRPSALTDRPPCHPYLTASSSTAYYLQIRLTFQFEQACITNLPENLPLCQWRHWPGLGFNWWWI